MWCYRSKVSSTGPSILSHLILSSIWSFNVKHCVTYQVLLPYIAITFCHFLRVFHRVPLQLVLMSWHFISFVSYMPAVTCAGVGDNVIRSMGTVNDILSSSMVTVCGRMRSTLYRPGSHRRNLFYWWLAITSAASKAIADWDHRPIRSPLPWISAPVIHSYCSRVYTVIEPDTVGLRQQFSSTQLVVEDYVAYIVVSHVPAHLFQRQLVI